MTADTIFALSTGSPPAAIAVVRISGPRAGEALRLLAGDPVPTARKAVLRELKLDGEPLDRALVLRFPGPHSATGEDLAELHLHGGRAVVAAVLRALARIPGLRAAEAGEFTRRAFENGRIDLAEAEGLADLLAAETESQRRAGLAAAGGAIGRQAAAWRERLLALSASLEAVLDFSDEGEVGEAWPAGWPEDARALAAELVEFIGRPPAERLRDGIRVVIAGPPNTGKSSLLNYIVQREAAIAAPTAGTTRDFIEAPVEIGGIPFLFVDTAGLHDAAEDIEAIGVARAQSQIENADLLLWLGPAKEMPAGRGAIRVRSRIDVAPAPAAAAEFQVSVVTGQGMPALIDELIGRAAQLLPHEAEVVANGRQRAVICEAAVLLREAIDAEDIVIAAEAVRHSLAALGRVTRGAGVEDMLDTLFGRFCVGK